MKLPGENSMNRMILEHMSRDVWIDMPLLYNLFWQIGEMPTQEQFAVCISFLKAKGFLDFRRAFVGQQEDDDKHVYKAQYRLSEKAATELAKLPKVRRGRVMGRKPAANCNWFKAPSARSRSVI